MSLINQMLKDLDSRHAEDARSRLHREVRALPVPARSGSPLRAVGIGAAVAAALAVGGWAYLQYENGVPAAPAVLASAPAVPAAAPTVASEAPPAVPMVNAVPTTNAGETVVASQLLASPVPASGANSPAVADAEGMKLSVAIDRLPQSAAPVRQPASMPPVGVSTPRREPAVPPAAKASPAPVSAPASVEKRASGAAGGREQSEAEYRRAMALVNGARIHEATDVLLDVLRRDGGHAASRQLLVRLLIEQRRLDEAAAMLAEGLATQPGQVGWAMSLARLQVERGDLAAAGRTLLAAEQYAAGNADFLGFSGHVQHRLGQYRAAAERYLTATRIAPGEGRWWLGLGLALEAEQRAVEAREAFLRARASGSLNADLAAIVDQKLR